MTNITMINIKCNKHIVNTVFMLVLILLSSIINSQIFANYNDGCFTYTDEALTKLSWYTCSNTEVVIPSNVVEIVNWGSSSWVFYNRWITSVDFSNATNLKTIWNYAFQNNDLTSVVIPSNIETIWSYAFGYNKLEDIVFPSTLETIWGGAFYDNNLNHVKFLRQSRTSIWSNAFYYQNKRGSSWLTSINDIVFGDWVVYDDTWQISIVDGCIAYTNESKNTIKLYLCDSDSVVVPSWVVEILDYAFNDGELKQVSFPTTLKTIWS